MTPERLKAMTDLVDLDGDGTGTVGFWQFFAVQAAPALALALALP